MSKDHRGVVQSGDGYLLTGIISRFAKRSRNISPNIADSSGRICPLSACKRFAAIELVRERLSPRW